MSDQRFITPDSFFNEIDNTEKPGTDAGIRGPVLIGRASKGPMMVPVKLKSPEELVRVFGYPISGTRGGDVWRGGMTLAPTYSLYAALAYLSHGLPVTFIRLAGVEHPDRVDDAGEAGFKTLYTTYDDNTSGPSKSFNGGAYGLFIADKTPDATDGTANYGDLVLAAKFYVNSGALALSGTGIDYAVPASATRTATNTGLVTLTTLTGKYTGPGYPTIIVRCKSEGTPDKVEVSFDGGLTWGAEISVTNPAPVDLGYGISGVFSATDASTAGDTWTIAVTTGTAHATASATAVASVGTEYEFKMKVFDGDFSDSAGADDATAVLSTIRFNFNPNSTNYIRKVFNTYPTLVNSDITVAASVAPYWLGETYDQYLKQQLDETTGSGNQFAVLLKIEADGANVTGEGTDYRFGLEPSKTGWFFAQDLSDDYSSYLPANMPKLFRFHSLMDGEWVQKNLKISINNLRYANTSSTNPELRYGRFDVEVRSVSDSDRKVEFVERYADLSLNPNDSKYIAKAIGTKYYEYDATKRRYMPRNGKYANVSNFIRVEMADAVEEKTIAPEILPFGVYGPTAFANITFSNVANTLTANEFVRGSRSAAKKIPFGTSVGASDINYDTVASTFSVTIKDAGHRLRTTSEQENTVQPKQVYWGVTASKDGTYKYDSSYEDIIRHKSIMAYGKEGSDTGFKYDYTFSLDNVRYKWDGTSTYTITSGATFDLTGTDGRANGHSITAGEETDTAGVSLGLTPDYKHIIDAGFARFTTSFWGGFDGLDVTEKEPFRNERLSDGGGDPAQNYAYYTVTRALEILADKIKYKYNLVSMPGLTDQALNTAIQALTEEHKIAIGVIDVAGWYKPSHENNESETDRTGSVEEAVAELQSYDFNTSWLCTYANWLQIKDRWNGNNLVWVPPSVGAIDCLGMSQKISGNVGIAPAGQTRGNLSSSEAGLNYVGAMFEFDKDDLDLLNENLFNPIYVVDNGNIQVENAQTLYKTKSDLQELQIRRHMLWVKESLEKLSRSVIFDNNISTTWNRFKSPAEAFLSGEKSAGVLEDYKLILDETTTTEDLKDRNIMKAKIYLKYANMIKWVWVDLILTNDIPK